MSSLKNTITLNGEDQLIFPSQPYFFDLTTGNTVSLAIKAETGSTNSTQYLLFQESYTENANVNNFGLILENYNLKFYAKSSNENDICQSTGQTFSDGEWHYVVATYDFQSESGITRDLYIDGILVDSNSGTTIVSGYTTSLTHPMGAMVSGNTTINHFKGELSEVSFFINEYFSLDHVDELFNLDLNPNFHSRSHNLFGYYNFVNDDQPNKILGIKDQLFINDFTSVNLSWKDYKQEDVMSKLVRIYGGCKDKALSFNGIDEYVDIGTSLTPYTLGSVSLWFKTTSVDTHALFSLYAPGTNNNYFIINVGFPSTGQLWFNVRGNQVNTTQTYNDGSWHHVIVTHDGSVTRMYADGVFLVSASGLGGSTTSSFGGSIGFNNALSVNYFNGAIDNVQVFNKALTISEVQEIYNNGRPINPLSYSFVDSLAAAYSLGENDTFSGAGIENLVGTNGTAVNMDSSNIVCGVESSITDCTSNALRFNGSDEYVDIGTSLTSYTLGSVSLWFKNTSVGSQALFSLYAPGTNNNYFLIYIGFPSAGQLFFNVRGNSTNTTQTYNDGSWHHVIVTHDGSVTRMYVDGVFLVSDSGLGGSTLSSFGGSIGFNNAFSVDYFNGAIDEVSVFSTTLSQSEVDELYNQGIPLDATTHSQSSNLSAYWKFTDSDTFGSNGILDSSGNANHGTATNMDSTNLVCGVDNDPQIICNSDEVLDLNPVLYLDRACSNFTVASGSAISQWNDISGNNYHATQSTVSARPILTPEGVSFDGSDDLMSIADNNNLSFTSGGADLPFSMFYEGEITFNGSSGTSNILINKDLSPFTTREYILVIWNNSIRVYYLIDSANYISSYTTATYTTGVYKIVVTYDGSEINSGIHIYVNGVDEPLSIINIGTYTGMSNTANNLTIGGRNQSPIHEKQKVSKVAIFNYELTPQQAIDLTS